MVRGFCNIKHFLVIGGHMATKLGYEIKGHGMHPTDITKDNTNKELPQTFYYMCSHFRLKKKSNERFNCDYEHHNCSFWKGLTAKDCPSFEEDRNSVSRQKRLNYGEKLLRKQNNERIHDVKTETRASGPTKGQRIKKYVIDKTIQSKWIRDCIKYEIDKDGHQGIGIFLNIEFDRVPNNPRGQKKVINDVKAAVDDLNSDVQFECINGLVICKGFEHDTLLKKYVGTHDKANSLWLFHTGTEFNELDVLKAIKAFIQVIEEGMEKKKYLVTNYAVTKVTAGNMKEKIVISKKKKK